MAQSKQRGEEAELISFEKDADRASRGQTVEGRSSQKLDSIQMDSSHHHLSEAS